MVLNSHLLNKLARICSLIVGPDADRTYKPSNNNGGAGAQKLNPIKNFQYEIPLADKSDCPVKNANGTRKEIEIL